jgi:putative ABC transport system substrate-binding protein
MEHDRHGRAGAPVIKRGPAIRRHVTRALSGLVPLAFTALLGTASPADAAGVPRVLVIGPLESYGGLVAGISEGLQANGYRDAGQIRVDVQNIRSLDEAKSAVAAAVTSGVDVIVTVFGQATLAAHQQAPAIPVVFCPVADPVATTLVASVESPGGHLTGVATADPEATRRRVAAFRQVVPGLRRLGVFFDPGFPPDLTQLANLERVASGASLTLVKREAQDADAAVRLLRELGPDRVDAVFFLTEPLLRRAGSEIGRAAVERRVPLLVGDPDLVTVPGVVASVGPDQRGMGLIAGEMTARILHGASPAAIAVAHPSFELIVNLKAASDLGVELPADAVRNAGKVIR